MLARSHDASPAVKSLASDVAASAAKGNAFLSRYAKEHGITLRGKPTLRADMQYGEMSAVKGRAFDRRFTQDLYADTSLQQSDFERSVRDPALSRFARRENGELGRLADQAEKLGG